ncbi:5'/3'-nucleotidase SurE [soil metagenome]|nr:5'/3'-nucleotidase SurE [Trueperaceae bacterium]
MRILVSNDDGVYSPGIHALARVAQGYGDVRLVAPDVEQSAMGHAITVRRPLHYHRTPIEGIEAYRVDGTPADAVALGTHHWDKVDLVVSGINLGLNIGHNIWHSGTVGAAKQAAFLGIPAIAFSGPVDEDPIDYAVYEPYIREVIDLMLDIGDLPLLNVNFPIAPKGMRWTRQSVRHYDGYLIPGEDPKGRTHYWFSEEPREQVEEGTDRWAIEQGFVSLNPIRLDLTDDLRLERALRKTQRH